MNHGSPPFVVVSPRRLEWWKAEKQTILVARVLLTIVRIHPTDTSAGICEQLGREMIDDVVNRLSSSETRP